jgi:hypothetical protein
MPLTAIPSDDAQIHQRNDVAAIALCLLSLVTALTLAYFHKIGIVTYETDFYDFYAPQAENILAGRPYTFIANGPGYVLVLAAVSSITGDPFVAGKLISAVSTAIFGWLTYSLFTALFGSRVALTSTALLLLLMLQYSFIACNDVIAAATMILPLWVLLRRPVVTPAMCFLGGMCAGIAYLIRYNATFIPIGIGFAFFIINFTQETWRKRFVKFGLFMGGVLLIVSPWLMVNTRINGSPFANLSYLQIAAHFYYPTGDMYTPQANEELAPYFHSLVDVVLYNPTHVLKTYLYSVLYGYIVRLQLEILQFPAYLFTGAGILFLLKDICRRRLTFIFVSILGFVLLGLVGYHARYYLFLYPVLVLPVTYFLFHERISDFLGQLRFSAIPVNWLVLCIIIGFMGYNALYITAKTIAKEPRYFFESAEFLKRHSTPDDIIVVYKPHLTYLAGRKRVFPLGRSAEDFVAKARALGARFIVYSEVDAKIWPPLESLRDPDAVPDALTVVYRHEPSKTIIYKIIS